MRGWDPVIQAFKLASFLKESHLLSSQLSDTIIAIRSARVDSVELIKRLTSRGSTIARQQANFIAHTPDVDSSPALESAPTDKCDEDTEDSAFSDQSFAMRTRILMKNIQCTTIVKTSRSQMIMM